MDTEIIPLAQRQDRERIAIRWLPFFPGFSTELLFRQLRIHPRNYWIMYDVPNYLLIPGTEGDADIILGEIKDSKPSTERLIALEAKSALASYDTNGVPEAPFTNKKPILKKTDSSSGARRRIHGQLNTLSRIGFDEVGILDILPTTPLQSTNLNGQDWISALDSSITAKKLSETYIKERLAELSTYHHFQWIIASIPGRKEYEAGSSKINSIRVPSSSIDNTSERETNRPILRENLRQLLNSFPKTSAYPSLWHFTEGKWKILNKPV